MKVNFSEKLKIFFWISVFAAAHLSIYAGSSHLAQKGVLDLRKSQGDLQITSLSGEWEFYWQEIILPGDFIQDNQPHTFASVPSYWTSYKKDLPGVTGLGYGTYRLKILLPEHHHDSLCLEIPVFDTSYELFLNGELVSSNGKVGTSREESEPGYLPVVHCFTYSSDTLEIVVHVSNFLHRRGGFWLDVKIGDKDLIMKSLEKNKILTYSLIGVLLLTSLSFLLFFLLERKNLSFIFFALTTLGVFLRLINTGLFPEKYIFDFPWIWNIRLEYIGTFIAFSFGVLYLHNRLPSKGMQKPVYINALIHLALSLMVMVSKPLVFGYTMYFVYFSALFFFPYYLYRSFSGMIQRKLPASALFISFLFLILAAVNDMLVSQSASPLNHQYFLPLVFLLFIGMQILTIMIEWISNYREKIAMHLELQQINQNLESLIEERTANLNRTNEKLKKALELKNRMYSIIAHDLKSPIASLAQFSELMVEKFQEREEREMMFELQKLSYSSVDLIENMLYWGMKQEDHIQYQPEMVSIPNVVQELVKLNSYTLDKKNITLEVELNEDIEAYCDIILFKISLRNILTNAVKFTPGNGTVRITSSKENDLVNVTVSDTGAGMEKELIDSIFANKIDKTAGTSGERGTGIGLIVVKDLIKINRGSLKIESKPGRGTSVTFTLPGKP